MQCRVSMAPERSSPTNLSELLMPLEQPVLPPRRLGRHNHRRNIVTRKLRR